MPSEPFYLIYVVVHAICRAKNNRYYRMKTGLQCLGLLQDAAALRVAGRTAVTNPAVAWQIYFQSPSTTSVAGCASTGNDAATATTSSTGISSTSNNTRNNTSNNSLHQQLHQQHKPLYHNTQLAPEAPGPKPPLPPSAATTLKS